MKKKFVVAIRGLLIVIFLFSFLGCGKKDAVNHIIEEDTNFIMDESATEDELTSESVFEEKSITELEHEEEPKPESESTFDNEGDFSNVKNFKIEGKWMSVGETGFGQVQP